MYKKSEYEYVDVHAAITKIHYMYIHIFNYVYI